MAGQVVDPVASSGAVAISVTSKSTNPNSPLVVKAYYNSASITDVTKQQLLLFSKVFFLFCNQWVLLFL